MNVDIDLIQTGQWTERLLQSEISPSDIERARLYGLNDDVHVKPLSNHPGHFEILGSPKTWLIAQLLQQQSVPVKSIEHLSDTELTGYYLSLESPSTTSFVTPPAHFIDRARSLQTRIQVQNLSLTEAGRLIGKSRSEVCNLMRILKIDNVLLDQIKKHPKIGFGHAKIMAGLQATQQNKLFKCVVNEGLTVQETESLARDFRENRAQNSSELGSSVSDSAVLSTVATSSSMLKKKPVKKSADVLRLEMMLTEHFSAQVEINEKDSKLEINYHDNLDILQGILDKIGLSEI